jgi:hypothetical protein
MNDLRKFAADKAAALVEKHRANTAAGRRKDAAAAEAVGSVASQLAEKFKNLSPGAQRVLLGSGIGAGIGGLLGLQGATSKKDAERSRLMDMLRGATAGGLAGGGATLGYNALTSGGKPLQVQLDGVGPISANEMVSALDAARAEQPGTGFVGGLTSAARMSPAGATGAAVGGALEAYDRLSPTKRTGRFLEDLARLAKESPDTGAKANYQKLYDVLSKDNSKVPEFMAVLRKHQTGGAFRAPQLSELNPLQMLRRHRAGRQIFAPPAPKYSPHSVRRQVAAANAALRVPSLVELATGQAHNLPPVTASSPGIRKELEPDAVRAYIDNKFGEGTVSGKGRRKPFLDASAPIGRDSFKPLPGGTPRQSWWKRPAGLGLAGVGFTALNASLPSIASMMPSEGLSNEEVLEALRKGK